MGARLGAQATGVVATAIWSAAATYVIVLITGAVRGMRTSDENEVEGLDDAEHGERGYRF